MCRSSPAASRSSSARRVRAGRLSQPWAARQPCATSTCCCRAPSTARTTRASRPAPGWCARGERAGWYTSGEPDRRGCAQLLHGALADAAAARRRRHGQGWRGGPSVLQAGFDLEGYVAEGSGGRDVLCPTIHLRAFGTASKTTVTLRCWRPRGGRGRRDGRPREGGAAGRGTRRSSACSRADPTEVGDASATEPACRDERRAVRRPSVGATKLRRSKLTTNIHHAYNAIKITPPVFCKVLSQKEAKRKSSTAGKKQAPRPHDSRAGVDAHPEGRHGTVGVSPRPSGGCAGV